MRPYFFHSRQRLLNTRFLSRPCLVKLQVKRRVKPRRQNTLKLYSW
jgi:hypothetical protein